MFESSEEKGESEVEGGKSQREYSMQDEKVDSSNFDPKTKDTEDSTRETQEQMPQKMEEKSQKEYSTENIKSNLDTETKNAEDSEREIQQQIFQPVLKKETKKEKKKKKKGPDEETLKRETLSLHEFNEMYDINFQLKPKNFRISMECVAASEPEFIVDLIVKVKFNSISFWKEIEYEGIDREGSILEEVDEKCFIKRSSLRQGVSGRNIDWDEDMSNNFRKPLKRRISSISTNLERDSNESTEQKSYAGDTTYQEFLKHHLLPIPTIRAINDGEPDSMPDTFHLQKLPIKKDEMDRLDILMRKATEGNGTASSYYLKMVRYESVQLYHKFRISFDGYTKNITRFPLDTHIVNFGITFTPVFMYCSKNKDYYELKVGDNKGKTLKIKGHYYPKVKTLEHFPLHSYTSVDERILDFDIIPESLSINKCDYGIRNSGEYTNKKVALMISFSLYRLITAPFINLFLPIYVIAILVPFSLFFREETDCDDGNGNGNRNVVGDFDLTATYLSTLLLTLVAHRNIISTSQVAMVALTTCDRDFLCCLMLIVGQMISFVISELRGDNSTYATHYIIWFFGEEALIMMLYILPRCYILLCNSGRKTGTKPLLLSEYTAFRSDIRMFGLKTKKVHQKTFFSSTIKIIAGYGSQQTRKAEVVATQIDDLYRIRLYDDIKAREVLMEIKTNPFFQEEYTDNLTEEAGGIKVVYSYTKSKKLFLEVEILRTKEQDAMMSNYDRENKLQRYRTSKQEKLSKHSRKLSCLTKGHARWLYHLSCLVEVYRIFVGNGTSLKEWCPSGVGRRIGENWTRIQEDGKLLEVVLSLLDSQVEHERVCPEIKKEIESFWEDSSCVTKQ